MSDLIGKSLGRYRILEQIGEGGMASVYKAHDTRLDVEVAVKVIRTEKLAPEILQRSLIRFEREAKTLARLNHPNIIRVTDFGEHEGKPYLVMPYFPGGSLKQRMGKPILWQEALQLIIPIARALDYAHRQNMIHRDVKPSNILMTADGEPMLTDFGIAKVLDLEETADLTGTGMGIGTPEYMAPEQWQGNTSTQSDLYSLGVVFYEMITGRKPYTANTPAALLLKQATEPLPRPNEFVRDLPDKVEKILLRALAKEPKERFKDMGEFVKDLDNGLKTDKAPVERPIREPAQAHLRRTSEKQAGGNRVQDGTRPTQTAVPEKSYGRANAGQSMGKSKRNALLPVSIILGLGALLFGVYLFNDFKTASLSLTPQLLSASTGETSVTETFVVTKIIFTDTPAVTLTPTALSEEIVDEKGVSMRLVPAGEFTMGNLASLVVEQCKLFMSNDERCIETLFEDQGPPHHVYLDTFYIDVYEVTNANYKKCVDAGSCTLPINLRSIARPSYYTDPDFGNYPVIYVDWYQASTYCKWRNSYLPTEAQWEKAARGTSGLMYPWGNEFNKAFANHSTDFIYNDTAPIGSYERDKSPYGVYDMGGNVSEWVSDWYSQSYYTNSPVTNPIGPATGQDRIIRGGDWITQHGHYLLTTYRHPISPNYASYAIGFRCVRLEE